MSDWQPIETAPKDGSVIWGWTRHQAGVARRVRWGRGYNATYECWRSERGSPLTYNPTHWIALPELPK